MAQPGRPAHLERSVHGHPAAVPGDYEVETAGPTGHARRPRGRGRLGRRGEGLGARRAGHHRGQQGHATTSRSTWAANWHDGQPITIADAVYSIAQGFDRAYDPEKAKIETALAVTARPYLETFKGFRLTDDDQLEVYVDYWHFDEDHIAAYANPVSFDMPWEVKAAMDDLVFEQRRAAYSDTAASRFSVPWLSLVLRGMPASWTAPCAQMERDEVVPAGLFEFGGRSLVTPEEATARYEAAQEWYDEHDHLVISNGPFYLERFDPPAQFAELDAFRDPTYPFKPGDLYRGAPPELTIDDVTADRGRPRRGHRRHAPP